VESDDVDTAPPPGTGGSAAADKLAEEVAGKAGVADPNDSAAGAAADEQDAPDTSLKVEKLNTASNEDGIEKKLADDVQTPYKSAKTFKELGLQESLLEGIFNVMKFEKPSKIQAETLPMILEPPHRNLIAQAHNGSGKTTCFVLGMLSLVDPEVKQPQALCICPTRELAIQNLDRTEKMGTFCTGTTYALVVPGNNFSSAIQDQILIGTPGRMADMVRRRKINLDHIRCVVFDEADEMLARGFRDFSITLLKEIDKKREKKGKECQKILFSATFSEEVREFAVSKIPKANHIFLKAMDLKIDLIKQYRVTVPSKEAKAEVIKKIFELGDLGQTIIFVRTKASARELHSQLAAEGHKCTSITGDMQPKERDHVIKEFIEGTTRTMIATDVLSRGFDVDNVTLVVNHDVPTERTGNPAYETYLHRVGRTGRFGRKGAAFNLILGNTENVQLSSIGKKYGIVLDDIQWDSEEAILSSLENAGLSAL